jgi:co-chaperonin GroES (HSP10)
MIRPIGDRILVNRLEGYGIERTTPGGIIIPAVTEKSVRTKPDYFKAKVLAVGPWAERAIPDLAVGETVLVYTYSGTAETVWTGDAAEGVGLFIRPDDILGVLEAA